MTTTIEETVADPLASLPSHKAGDTLASVAAVPAETEVRYLPIPDFPGTYDGVALVSADEENRGHMWEVNAERVRQSRALDPYRGCYGWWVNLATLGPVVEDIVPPEPPMHPLAQRLTQYRVRRDVNAYLTENRIVPVIEREGPFHRVGIVLAPPAAGPVGNMWLVDEGHIAEVPELRHFPRWYAQWVTGEQVERHGPPTNEAGADLTDVPQEHRFHIPPDSRWGTTTYGGLPEGRYLFHRVPASNSDLIAALWPGHPAFNHGGHRPGLLDTWRGWWVPDHAMEFDTEPTPEPTEADDHPISARYRHLLPENTVVGRLVDRDVTGFPPGRYAAVPFGDTGRWVLIAEPDQPGYAFAQQWQSLDLGLPLQGKRLAARRRFVPDVIEATEATPTEEAAPVPTVVPIRSDELEALHARVASLEADLVTVGRMMGEEAHRRDWCGEYESVMEQINRNLSNPMPIHRPMVTVAADFSGTVTTRFQGSVSVEVPVGAGRGQIREAMRAVLAERGLASEAEIVDSEAQWTAVDISEIRLDNWETA